MRYPRLNKLILNLLNISISNAEIKYIFLKCALALNDKRLNIISKIFKKFIFFRLWRYWEERGGQIDVNASSLLYILLIFIKIFGGGYVGGRENKRGKELSVVKNIGTRY